MTGGLPDSWKVGGDLAELPPLMMMGRVGAGRRIRPLRTKAMIHPVAEGKEGGMSASSRDPTRDAPVIF